MKKFFTILLVMIMLISCMTTVAFAHKVGDEVTISFYIEENPGFSTYGATVNYDTEALTLKEINAGELSADGLFVPNNGKVSFTRVNAQKEDQTGTGVLFTATFEITNAANSGTVYPVTAVLDNKSTANAMDVAVTLNIIGGSITIDECKHNLVEDMTKHKDAACEEAGYEFWKCSKCTYTEERTPAATGHEWKLKEKVPSTCTTLGYEKYECDNDGSHTKKEDYTKYGDHKYELKKEVPSTCVALGYKYYECEYNSEHTKTEYATAYGDHEWGEDGKCKNCTAVKPNDPVIPVVPSTPGTPAAPAAPGVATVTPPFTDVKKGDWYYDSIKFVYENGLMNGTGNGQFSPNANTTRGMIVTILARLEGVDTSKGATWYEAGQQWAMKNGISDGTSMDGQITREQLATMLYRYAQLKGYDTKASADLSTFEDAASVSDWAKEAMQWAVGVGLIQGSDNQLTPTAPATRAQVAAILMRFMENVVK